MFLMVEVEPRTSCMLSTLGMCSPLSYTPLRTLPQCILILPYVTSPFFLSLCIITHTLQPYPQTYLLKKRLPKVEIAAYRECNWNEMLHFTWYCQIVLCWVYTSLCIYPLTRSVHLLAFPTLLQILPFFKNFANLREIWSHWGGPRMWVNIVYHVHVQGERVRTSALGHKYHWGLKLTASPSHSPWPPTVLKTKQSSHWLLWWKDFLWTYQHSLQCDWPVPECTK